MRRKTLALLVLLVFLVSIIAPALSPSFGQKVSAQTQNPLDYYAKYDFENGTQGWMARGASTTVETVYKVVYEGDYSLKVSGRTSAWDGAIVDLTSELAPSVTYTVSMYVYHNDAKPQRFSVYAYLKDSAGEKYIQVIDKVAVPNFWKKINGKFTITTSNQIEKIQLLVCVPTSKTVEFYVDNIEIAGPNRAGINPVVKSTTFESGIFEGWQPRGSSVSISVVDTVTHTGSKSLYVTGRTQNWNGAQIDVTSLLEKGKSYEISVWVYQDTGSTQKLTLTMERKNADGSTDYDSIVHQKDVGTNTWVELKGTYSVPTTAIQLLLYVESPNATLSFYIDDLKIVDPNPGTAGVRQPEWEIPSLFEQYKNYFSIGVAIPYRVLTNPVEVQMVLKHFNSITAENEMKPDAIQKTEGNFTFNVADEYVNFAQQNGIGIRGHTLVWHQQTPDWFFKRSDGTALDPNKPEDKQLLRDRLKTHIQTLVGRYAGKIYAWDVVNEAIDENQPDGYRRSEWYRILGPTPETGGIPEYIILAFQYARQADPNAKLFYNDYNTENPKKRQFIYNLVKALHERGLIDGVGLQGHINVESPTVKEIEDTIKLFSTIPGLEVQITELDISVYTSSSQSYNSLPQDIAIKQAQKFRDIFEMLKKYKGIVTNVTFWGLKDDYSWLSKNGPNWPLLFDSNYQAKYAYWAIVEPSVLPLAINKAYANNAQPRIDGLMDKEYKGTIPVTIQNDAGQDIAQVRSLWNGNELSLYITVNDTSVDVNNDKVMIFVDRDNGKLPELKDDDHWVSISRTGAKTESKIGYVKDYVVLQQLSGYVVEVKLLLNNSLAVNSSIGFDIAVVDNGVQYSWNDKTNSQLIGTDTYGILTMADSVKFASAPKGTPKIDAELDDAWQNAQEITTDTKVTVTGTVYDSAYAKARMMWDENCIYVYAVVYDPLLNKANTNPWEQDSIEIFIDENNHKTPYYENDDVQYRVNYENTQTFGTNGEAKNFITATKIIPNGYIVEAQVYMRTTKLSEGMVIGFDIQVNDADNTGKRVGVLTWNDKIGNNWRDTTKFGCLELIAAPVQQPTVQQPSTSPSTSTTITYIITSTTPSQQTQTQQQTQQTQQQTQQQQTTQQPAQQQQQQQTTQQTQQQEGVVTTKINPTSATTVNVGNDIKVVVPQGAVLGANATIKVEKIEKLDKEIGLGTLVEKPIKVTIENGNVVKPVKLEVKVEPQVFKDDNIPVAFAYDEQKGKWLPVATKKDVSSVTITTNKVGTVAVVVARLDEIYKDISKDNWAYDTFKKAVTSGLIVGYEDMTLKPTKQVSFAEAAVVAQRAFEIAPKQEGTVKNTPQWAAQAIKALLDNEVITEVDDANRPLTRIEAVAIIMKLLEQSGVDIEPKELEFTDLLEQSSIDVEYLAKAYSLGIVKGYPDKTFRPQNTITRAEFIALIMRALDVLRK
ncbi:endo-1,4-beta-xylanase [Caldicellulosiruptor naganoensis]|uniref:Beta-xylanase n=1 Tax=Caldicellulosiruptor naganoensis TaxID=29324 RepID=A0ABY7BF62_9FIRM|nr:endo-1,4-beta-xylanase [Caldicellulosiruptor naganoensis]WAM31244.1 endo-1,4-beta-xylanase [Caldicellulosiruptor naganoensis]